MALVEVTVYPNVKSAVNPEHISFMYPGLHNDKIYIHLDNGKEIALVPGHNQTIWQLWDDLMSKFNGREPTP